MCCCKGGSGAFHFAGFSQCDLWDQVLTGTKADGREDLFCMASRNLKAGWLFWGFFLIAYVLLGLYHTLAFLSHVFTELLG